MRAAFLSAPAAWFLVCAVLASPVTAGTVQYPALGNVRLDEGTIEAWFTPMAELYPELKEGQFRGAFPLFALNVEGEFRVSANWASKAGALSRVNGLGVNIANLSGPRDAMHNLTLSNVPGWKPGERHHVAFTWKGKEMALIVDGKTHSARVQSMPFPGRPGDAVLEFGGVGGRNSAIILHAVRTSTIARSAEALKGAEPAADLHTILLDRFDRPDALTMAAEGKAPRATTRPLVASRLPGVSVGIVIGTARFVDTPAPGIALFPAQ